MIAIIGYGSEIRHDDYIGIYAARHIQKKFKDSVHVYEGYNSVDLLMLFEHYTELFIIDAAFLEKDVGGFVKVPVEELNIPDDTSFASHDTNFKQLLPLARSMGYKIPRITFYLIQPSVLEIGEGFSPELQKKIPEFLEYLEKEVSQIQKGSLE
ncbi:MAG: hydrogenase maturation protease [Candidatus Woesearchaeota archaeon]